MSLSVTNSFNGLFFHTNTYTPEYIYTGTSNTVTNITTNNVNYRLFSFISNGTIRFNKDVTANVLIVGGGGAGGGRCNRVINQGSGGGAVGLLV
jgi:hypothetical protein